MILNKIHKKFDHLTVLKEISFEIEQGQIFSIVGQTGCGKSTLLNIISGIEEQTKGDLNLGENKSVGYLLQENVLLPWRTLYENITLGLEIKKKRLNNEKKRINELIDRFGLWGFENYYPDKLSGGMRQRTALITCLIHNPDVLLLDEPFSNLDFDSKIRIQEELLRYHQETNCSIIMVTHDIEDAIVLSDVIITLSGKPTVVKSSTVIDLDTKNPISARKSKQMPEYFTKIWNDLKNEK
ncbi:MAG: ABC transporter ATP-binding protein [Allomuricauda sp.]